MPVENLNYSCWVSMCAFSPFFVFASVLYVLVYRVRGPWRPIASGLRTWSHCFNGLPHHTTMIVCAPLTLCHYSLNYCIISLASTHFTNYTWLSSWPERLLSCVFTHRAGRQFRRLHFCLLNSWCLCFIFYASRQTFHRNSNNTTKCTLLICWLWELVKITCCHEEHCAYIHEFYICKHTFRLHGLNVNFLHAQCQFQHWSTKYRCIK